MATYKSTPHSNVYGSRFIVRMESGSNPWFTVLDNGKEIHPINASWVPLPAERVEELRTQGIVSDGLVRFFRTKRDLLAALNG